MTLRANRIIQDGTRLWFDDACFFGSRDADLTGNYTLGKVVGHQAPEGEYVYACCPLKSPARYILRRFIKAMT